MYIETTDALRGFCQQALQSGRVAVDTEFITERTYYPQLALIQAAVIPEQGSDPHCVIIDPLRCEDLGPLVALLQAPDVLKVMHAAKGDMEVFHWRLHCLPQPLFDTQIAAALLGYGDQLSLVAVLQKVLGVELKHHESYTEWMQRPLTEVQIQYALDDVRYLLPLHECFATELAKAGREAWVAEECAKLTRADLYDRGAPEDQYRRIKGWARLSASKQAVLQELAAWREKKARSQDVPRRRILRDEVLLDLARRSPRSKDDLYRLRGVRRGGLDRYADELIDIIHRSRRKTPARADRRGTRNTTGDLHRAIAVDLLTAVVKIRARQHQVSSQFLATRAELEDLYDRVRAGDTASHPVLSGWRRNICGEDLLALLQGRASISLEPETGKPVVDLRGEDTPPEE